MARLFCDENERLKHHEWVWCFKTISFRVERGWCFWEYCCSDQASDDKEDERCVNWASFLEGVATNVLERKCGGVPAKSERDCHKQNVCCSIRTSSCTHRRVFLVQHVTALSNPLLTKRNRPNFFGLFYIIKSDLKLHSCRSGQVVESIQLKPDKTSLVLILKRYPFQNSRMNLF